MFPARQAARALGCECVKAKLSYLSVGERVSYRRLEAWSAASGRQQCWLRSAAECEDPASSSDSFPEFSTKVLNERLRKLLDHRLITRKETQGKILRVEYALTSTGGKLAAIIEQIRDLDEEHAANESTIVKRLPS